MARYGDSFTYLCVDDVRTSQETHVLLLGPASTATIRSKSRRTRGHILLSHFRLSSHFIVCYDLQGYGGNNLTHLHTGVAYEERRLLGYKNPVRTSHETHYVSARDPSRLMLCKI
jgi:hypothetical protein